ncbi:hypothetical protein [Streptococcus canis]|uniref:hypothetical protein n=1 Tax=Streptococcus canis TaxID=1329 RepID=UPI002F963F6E
MKIKWQDNNKKVELDVELDELKGWLKIDVIEDESEEELQERIQEAINEEYNKPDYNNWHQHNRHIGYSKAKHEDGDDYFGHFKEPLISEVEDSSIFYKEENERNYREELENCYRFLNKHVNKQELVDLFTKVVFEGYTLREIAMIQNPRPEGMSEKEYKKLIAKVENNLSHKLVRVRKILEKIILETSDFDVPRGYLLEDKSSRNL